MAYDLLPRSSSMLFYKSWLAVSVVLILAGTAWIAADHSANPYFAYSILALLAYGLDLADGSTMGFVFINRKSVV